MKPWMTKKVNDKGKKRPEKGSKDAIWAEDWNEMVEYIKDLEKRITKLEK